MKNLLALTLMILLSGTVSRISADNMVAMKIGTTWPRALLRTGVPSGDAEVNYGIIIDKKVAFGIAGNFLWNVQAKTKSDSSGNHYITVSEQKTYMFPITGFFQIDPVPEAKVHPVIHFQIGYNSMIYSYSEKVDNAASKPLSPYFYGLIIKTGVDALYNIGDQSALFLGFSYRWADTRTVSNTHKLFDKRDMSGIGLCAGFRVIL